MSIRSIVSTVDYTRQSKVNQTLTRMHLLKCAISLTMSGYACYAFVASTLIVHHSIVDLFVETVSHSVDLDNFQTIFPYHKLALMTFYSEFDMLP